MPVVLLEQRHEQLEQEPVDTPYRVYSTGHYAGSRI